MYSNWCLVGLVACLAIGGLTVTPAWADSSEYTINGAQGALDGNGDLVPADSTSGNTLTITGGSSLDPNDIYGGKISAGAAGDAGGNRLIISGGEMTGSTYGGYVDFAGNGSASDNTIQINGGVLNNIYGGYISNQASGDANGNTIRITNNGSLDLSSSLYGGYVGTSATGTAKGNSISIITGDVMAGGSSLGAVFGGFVDQNSIGDASNNSITLIGGSQRYTPTLSLDNIIAGGYVGNGSTGDASHNEVKAIGALELSGYMYGGFVAGSSGTTGNASYNKVTLELFSRGINGVWGGKVAGGAGSANSNSLEIYGDGPGNATRNTIGIYRGVSYVMKNAYGGYAGGTGTASNNTVFVREQGTLENVNFFGGYSHSGGASDNTVTMQDYAGTEGGNLFGGATLNADAFNNQVFIKNNVDVGSVYGGMVGVYITVDNSMEYMAGTGNAYNNAVTVTGGKINGDVTGGHVSGTGDAQGNTVTIGGGEMEFVYGGYVGSADHNTVYGSGNARGNSVTVNGGSMYNIYGGYISGDTSGNANDNTVNVSNLDHGSGFFYYSYYDIYGGYNTGFGNADGNSVSLKNVRTNIVYGGYANNIGTSNNNTVTIETSDIINSLYGGYANENGEASGNAVFITKESTVGYIIYGGYVNSEGNADNNTVSIADSFIDNELYGGYVSYNGNADGNTISVSRSFVENTLYSGYVGGDGQANSNTVTIANNSMVSGSIYGGYVDNGGQANGNAFSVSSNSVVNGEVFGGFVGGNGISDGNTATAEGNSTVNQNLYGGHVWGTGQANDNAVVLSGATVAGDVYGGIVAGNVYDGDIVAITMAAEKLAEDGSPVSYAQRNTVDVFSGTAITGDVYGGFAGNTARNNTVNIFGGSIDGGVSGGYIADSGYSGSADDNTVNISGGRIGISPFGETRGSVFGGLGWGTANENTVNISGGKIAGDIYGGYTYAAATAIGNTISLSGSPTLNGVLYGGRTNDGMNDYSYRSGNTLKILNPNISVLSLDNSFQHYNFTLPEGITPGTTMLTLRNDNPERGIIPTDITTPAGAARTTVGLSLFGSAKMLPGDSVKLITDDTGNVTGDSAYPDVAARSGLKSYTFWIHVAPYDFQSMAPVDPASLLATLRTVELSQESENLPENKEAGMALVNQGADLAAGRGMQAAMQAASTGQAKDNLSGWTLFGIMSGGTSRYDTSARIDLDSISFITGASKNIRPDGANAWIGVFLEGGFGSYSARDSLPGGTVSGSGHSRYLGGGVLGRVEATEGWARGLYAEGTLRAGNLFTSYSSDDLISELGRAKYDTNSAYIGAHAGLGYLWDLSDKTTFDLYAKYFFTHVTSTSATVHGSDVNFGSSSSHRVRAGGQLSHKVSENAVPYIGAAIEYEFDGRVPYTVDGLKGNAPNLRGTTGIGEVGLRLTPDPKSPLFIDLSVQGYTGTRKGVGGTAYLRYDF